MLLPKGFDDPLFHFLRVGVAGAVTLTLDHVPRGGPRGRGARRWALRLEGLGVSLVADKPICKELCFALGCLCLSQYLCVWVCVCAFVCF